MTVVAYYLRGTVDSDRLSNHLRVEAWDSDARLPDLVDVAMTDARGSFEMRLDEAYVLALLPGTPTLTFRFFDGSETLRSTQPTVWTLRSHVTELRIP